MATDRTIEVPALADIPLGHMVAVKAMGDGDTVIKYDHDIGPVARSKVMVAAQRGGPIPDDWALNAEGRPTPHYDGTLVGGREGERAGAAWN